MRSRASDLRTPRSSRRRSGAGTEAAKLWEDVIRGVTRSRWGAPPFAPSFEERSPMPFRLVAGEGAMRFAVLHREQWWGDDWGGYGGPPISEGVSIQLTQWPLVQEAESFQERLLLLGIPGFVVAGLNPFDLAMYFALRNRSPSSDSTEQETRALRLLTVDDRLLAAVLRSARELEPFGPHRFRTQYPFEARCWAFLRRVFGDELQHLLGADGLALLESGRALDLHALQDVAPKQNYWLEIFARRAAAREPARRDHKPKSAFRRDLVT